MLGSADLTASTETLVYTVPSGRYAAVTVSFVARTQTAQARLAIANGTTPTAANYLEYDATLSAASVLERSGIVLQAGDRVYARASATGVSVNVYGIEELA